MALPMDEQRILEEMERMLAADDPRLASRLAAFGQPGVGHVLRTRRARAVLSLLTIGVIACVAAVIYTVNTIHPTGTQLTPHNSRSSQASGRPTSSLSANSAIRVPNAGRCLVLVTSGKCLVWSRGGSQAEHPSPATDQPAKAGKAGKAG
jgi:hypothetical protein